MWELPAQLSGLAELLAMSLRLTFSHRVFKVAPAPWPSAFRTARPRHLETLNTHTSQNPEP